MLALPVLALLAAPPAAASTAHARLRVEVVRYPWDEEPMVYVLDRAGRASFSRPGLEQCFDKLSGPRPCGEDALDLGDGAPPDPPPRPPWAGAPWPLRPDPASRPWPGLPPAGPGPAPVPLQAPLGPLGLGLGLIALGVVGRRPR